MKQKFRPKVVKSPDQKQQGSDLIVVVEFLRRPESRVNQLSDKLHQSLMLRAAVTLREKRADFDLRRFAS